MQLINGKKCQPIRTSMTLLGNSLLEIRCVNDELGVAFGTILEYERYMNDV